MHIQAFGAVEDILFGPTVFGPPQRDVFFDEGQMSAEVTVTFMQDSLFEPDETVEITVTDVTGGFVDNDTRRHVATITNDDPPPVVSFSVAPQVEEGAFLPCTVNLSAVSGTVTRVVLEARTFISDVAAGTADFTAGPVTVTIPAGQLSARVDIKTTEDIVDEQNQPFELVLRDPVNATLTTAAAGKLSRPVILDNDAAPVMTVRGGQSLSVPEGGGSIALTFDLSRPSEKITGSAFTLSTADGTAIAPADYAKVISRSIVFGGAQTSFTTTIPVVQDTSDEADSETFQVVPTLLPGIVEYTGSPVTVSIKDDDNPLPRFGIQAAGQVTEGGLQSFIVTLSPAVNAVTSVRVSTTNGTAASPGDFVQKISTLETFAPGQTAKVVQVQTVNDAVFELTETYQVSLASPLSAAGAIGLAASQATGTIIDNDIIPNVTVTAATVSEDAGMALVTFTIPRPNESGSTITWSARGGTAEPGADFAAITGDVITVVPDQTSYTRLIPIYQDELVEGGETVILEVSVSSGLTYTQGPVTLTIADDEPEPEVTLGDSEAVIEGGLQRFTVSLNRLSTQPVTVHYTTEDGTARAPGDYAPAAAGSVVIPAGAGSADILIPIQDDTADEPAQSYAVLLTSVEGAAPGDARGTGTIIDNDPAPVLTISTAATVMEGQAAVVTFRLDRLSEREPKLVFHTETGTAGAPADFSTVPATVVSFTPGEFATSLTVTTKTDTEGEGTEFFNILTRVLNEETLTSGYGPIAVSITDASAPLPALSVSDAHVIRSAEAPGTAVFTISLGSVPDTSVTVTCRTLAGAAQPGSDFAAFTGREVTFNPGSTTGTVTVTIPPGADDGEDETFTLEAVATLAAGQVTAAGTGQLHPFRIRNITAQNELVRLSVPVASDAFTLVESSSSMLPDSWHPVSAGTEPGWQEITVPADGARQFYRLRRP